MQYKQFWHYIECIVFIYFLFINMYLNLTLEGYVTCLFAQKPEKLSYLGFFFFFFEKTTYMVH